MPHPHAPLSMQSDSHRNLMWALGISVLLHAVFLTVKWISPSSIDRIFQSNSLEVVLVNSRSSQAPDKPQALATFGAAVSSKQIGLLASVADKVIIAMDNDDAGKQSSKKFFKSLPYFRKGVWWWDYSGTTAKDIGDMTNNEIELGLINSTQMPNW